MLTQEEVNEYLASVLTSEQYAAAIVDSEDIPPDEIDPEGWRYYSDVMTPETIAYQKAHPHEDE